MQYVIRKSNENKINSIEITTDKDQVVLLSEEEAQKLKVFLNDLFPEKTYFTLPERKEENPWPMPFPFKTPTYVPPYCPHPPPSPTIVPTEPFPYYTVTCNTNG